VHKVVYMGLMKEVLMYKVNLGEVLEALIDTQVNNRAKLGVQILDNFISKGLGLHMIFNMDSRDDDVPQKLCLLRGVKNKEVFLYISRDIKNINFAIV